MTTVTTVAPEATDVMTRAEALDFVLRKGTVLSRFVEHRVDEDTGEVADGPVTVFDVQMPNFDKGLFIADSRRPRDQRQALAKEVLRRAQGSKGKTCPALDRVRKGLASRSELTLEQIANGDF